MLIPKSVFELHRVCDPDARRYSLDGVQFSRASATSDPCAVATDGRCLVAATWKEPESPPSPEINATPLAGFAEVIPKECCLKAMDLGDTNRSTNPILDNIVLVEPPNANGTLSIGAGLKMVYRIDVRPNEGRFPKWQDIFPHYDDPVQINLNLEFLANLAATMAAVTKNGDRDRDSVVKVTLTVNRQAAPKDVNSGPVTLIARTEDGLTIAGVLSSTTGDPVTWDPSE